MSKIEDQVKSYYDTKINQFGATPQGVDWNSIESQELRFEVLSKLIIDTGDFSVLDFGCGFGSMYQYYKNKFSNFKYTGFDISEEMIIQAKSKFNKNQNAEWLQVLPDTAFDYVIASGIFNVKLENEHKEWLTYILKTLANLDKYSKKGFAFNILTSYSDLEYMKDYLYYADPLYFFDYCKTQFSRNVSLLHDYDLYEFSILVRK